MNFINLIVLQWHSYINPKASVNKVRSIKILSVMIVFSISILMGLPAEAGEWTLTGSLSKKNILVK